MKMNLIGCDICNKTAEEPAKGWYKVRIATGSYGAGGNAFMCEVYSDGADGKDVCGPACVLTLLQPWLEHKRIDVAAAPVPREL